MITILCSVRDSAVNAFMQPIFVRAVGEAVRSFADEVNRPESPMFKHPDDYELYEIGVFDDSNGSVTMLPEPRSLARGKDFKEVSNASVHPASGK